MAKLNRSMVDGPLLPNILLYTIPIILTGLLQSILQQACLYVDVKNRPIGRWGGWVMELHQRRMEWAKPHYISKGSMPRTGWPFSDR